mgnify:CR=1 FL=1
MSPTWRNWFSALKTALTTLCFLFFLAGAETLSAESQVFRCATSADVHAALKSVGPGDTILLEGGRVYETDASFILRASGTEEKPIRFTSEDPSGADRYAVITTVDGRKEPDLVAITLKGAWWEMSRIEIAGTRIPLEEGYWDTNGFRIGLYLQGAGSHHNRVEDLRIHHTHNTAVAVRDESHHNQFRRMHIHHAGEWLDADYNAHEGEGFYLGSSKGVAERGNNARAHDILIEDNVLGPGLLGQYVDIKYGVSSVTVRNNTFHCSEKAYNEEVVKIAGFGNRIENNDFVGDHTNLARYIHVFNKKTADPVLVDYKGKTGIPAPTGRDNTIVNNRFYTDRQDLKAVESDLRDDDRSTLYLENNRVLPPADWEGQP